MKRVLNIGLFLLGLPAAWGWSSSLTLLDGTSRTNAIRGPFCSAAKTIPITGRRPTSALLESTVHDGLEPDNLDVSTGPYMTISKSGTKLNLFGGLYGCLAIVLGLFWYAGLNACQLAYENPELDKLDPHRYWPILCGQVWGVSLMNLTNCHPKITGQENLSKIDGPVMFVANHASHMDIPFVCAAIGWQNYKIVAKKELLNVPVLGKSLQVAGHVLLDRNNRKSQLQSFKQGVHYLQNGVHLVAFAEGTRSKDGRLQPFKKGACKMAEKAHVAIIPLSIRNAHKMQPPKFAFPVTHSQEPLFPAEVVIGEPIMTDGVSDEEVTERVWNAIADYLPPSQKPLEGTPVVYSKQS